MADSGQMSVYDERRPAPICAIGASAGGVTALQTLFRLLPADLGLAYVIILHLAPDQPSAMDEILAACTNMPVLQVTDSPKLKRDCVYVIPPDRELVIDGDTITARAFGEPRGKRAPIDMFFRSIASARGDGIAIVMTGAGSDGALGIRAIKEAGGIVFVQEPAEAGFASMPQSAIATGQADFVGTISRLAERVAEVARSKEAVRSLDQDGEANELRRIISFLRARIGHDFSNYKRATVMRRVLRRLQVSRVESLGEYADYLRTSPEEAQALFSDLLISVTQFFRDPAAFDALARQAIRPIFEDVAEEGIRAWVAGCSTGEEAYSVAMLMLEEASRRKTQFPIQIFATDLDEGALATAREGRYPRSIEADVSEERLKRFFVDEGSYYRIRKEVRDTILFTKHSLLKDPPFMRLDLITCRNLLIYLERALQQQISSIFHYSLKPNRILFLGSAETADGTPELFVPLDREARLYQARPRTNQIVPLLPQFPAHQPTSYDPREGSPSPMGRDALPAINHAEALEQASPPSVLADAAHNIVHMSSSAGRFILHSAGPFNSRLAGIVRPELRLDLKLALDRAFEHRRPTLTHLIRTQFGDEVRRIAMQVIPLARPEHAIGQAIVFFLDGGEAGIAEESDVEGEAKPGDLFRLHTELKAAQEALIASRHDHEASVQELRAANEELQSINEEYRSTSEELETSKEELQSINEELQTVNAELKSKLKSISATHNDLQNLTAANEIGTLFLDSELRIKMFTPPVADLFNITDNDVGRSITHFTHRLHYDGIERDVHKVMRDLAPLEAEVQALDGRWFMMRLRPYRTIENRIEGAVVTFVDITARLNAEHKLARSQRRLLALAQASSQALYTMSPDWSQMRKLSSGGFLVDAIEPPDDWWSDYIYPEDQPGVRAAIKQAIDAKSFFELEHRVLREDGSLGWTLSRAVPILDEDQAIVEWFGAAIDITEEKNVAEQNSTLLAELQHRVRNVLALVTSLVGRTAESSESVDIYREKLLSRLGALARTQTLLTRAGNRGVDLRGLIRDELTAQVGDIDQSTISGDEVILMPRAAEVLTLAIHELATNAIKYGAFSQPGGRLTVNWSIDTKSDGSELHLEWLESGMNLSSEAGRAGFGTDLISGRVPYELKGMGTILRNPTGILCRISFPLKGGTSILETSAVLPASPARVER